MPEVEHSEQYNTASVEALGRLKPYIIRPALVVCANGDFDNPVESRNTALPRWRGGDKLRPRKRCELEPEGDSEESEILRSRARRRKQKVQVGIALCGGALRMASSGARRHES